MDDYDIVPIYGAEYRGVVNYYLPAQDAWRLGAFQMARPDVHAENPRAQAQVHRLQDGCPPPGKGRHPLRDEDLLRGQETARGQAGPSSTIRRDTPQAGQESSHPRAGPARPRAGLRYQRKELITRLRKRECELCEADGTVEAHQVASLRELGMPGPERPAWASLMARKRRKTLIVCAACHDWIHANPVTRAA